MTSSQHNETIGANEQYGVCNLSVVPVRTEPSDKSEISTQLVFGEQFKIISLSENKKWFKIQMHYDSYEGWIDRKQCKVISEKFYHLISSMEWPYNKDLIGLLHGKNKVIPILYGCSLPFYNNGIIALEDETYQFRGDVFYPIKNADFAYLKPIASFFLASPYLWGGRTHFGIDCSGFVQQVYRICGIKLPRDAWQQAKEGKEIAFAERAAGDIAYFVNEAKKVTHIGIVMEDSQIIHASGEVRLDHLDENGILIKSSKTYSHKLEGIRRVL